jgi:cytidylate kinase
VTASGAEGAGPVGRAVIAIDGPSGAGKSTVARALAVRLGLPHVDTGAYYRAATLAALRSGTDPEDPAVAEVVAASRIERRNGRTLLDGADVEDEIRGPAVTAAVSVVSRNPAVRALLVERQRAEVGPEGAVVEGRDAGTVIVPDADLKVWLTASPQERAARRAAQVGLPREAVEQQVADLARRDRLDARQMTPAPDVVTVDTTGTTVEDLVDQLVRLLQGAHT